MTGKNETVILCFLAITIFNLNNYNSTKNTCVRSLHSATREQSFADMAIGSRNKIKKVQKKALGRTTQLCNTAKGLLLLFLIT